MNDVARRSRPNPAEASRTYARRRRTCSLSRRPNEKIPAGERIGRRIRHGGIVRVNPYDLCELPMRPSKCARITSLKEAFLAGNQVIIESTLRTIWWSAQQVMTTSSNPIVTNHASIDCRLVTKHSRMKRLSLQCSAPTSQV